MNKYHNKITILDGYRFMSLKEANYYLVLKRMLQTKIITDLELQPKYQIELNGKRICKVILDFKYKDKRTGKIHHVDVKGKDTAMSKLRRRLVEAMYKFEVEIV